MKSLSGLSFDENGNCLWKHLNADGSLKRTTGASNEPEAPVVQEKIDSPGAVVAFKENSPIIHRMSTETTTITSAGTTTPTNPEVEVEMNPSARLTRERTQIYNARVLRWYKHHKSELPREWLWQVEALYENTTNINEFKTNYTLRGWAAELGCGRVYAAQKGSLETLPRPIRANLCADYYWDVDMENAQPNLLHQLARREGLHTPNLRYYCKNREKVLELLTPVMGSRKAVKDSIIATLYGANVSELAVLKTEMDVLTDHLQKQPQWRPLWEKAMKMKENVVGSFLAQVAQTLERQCLDALDEFFAERERSVDVLAYDGMMIRKLEDEAVMDPSLLREAETYVNEHLDWTIRLAIKPMELNIKREELDAIKVLTPAEQRWALLLEGTPAAFAEFYATIKGGETIYSPSLKTYFIYDKSSGLWRNRCPTDINNDFVRVMGIALKAMEATLPSKLQVKEMDAEDPRRKEIQRKLNAIGFALDQVAKKAVSIVSSFLPSHVMPDFEPVGVFNTATDLYPLQNGVYSFSQRRLLTYKKEHYFTFKIPINYNPEASTADIEKAMNQWFMGNKEVVAFMKFYIGYCLTPETKRQDFLTVWGETAGNGKSTLFGDLLPLLMGHHTNGAPDKERTFFHTLNVKDLLVSNSANSDSTYNLAGKRYAVMSEPKLDGTQKLDGEMLKRLTGDTSYSVCAKYKGEITFRPLAKIVVLCNKMFKIDVDCEGQLRRLLVAEMGSKFVSATDFAALSPADQKSGRYHIRDSGVVERLQGNLEGVLRYFLDGASDYVADRFRVPPPELYASKLKAVKDLDELARWIKGYLVKDGEEGAYLSLRQLKQHWKSTQPPFGGQIREKGFNKLFFTKCERLGLKTKWNEDRSDEGRVLGVRLYDAETDGDKGEGEAE